MLSERAQRTLVALAVLAPLPIVAAGIFWQWSWWIAVLPIVAVVVIVARSSSRVLTLVTTLLGVTGLILLADHDRDSVHPRNGFELAALAILLVLAVYLTSRAPQ